MVNTITQLGLVINHILFYSYMSSYGVVKLKLLLKGS